MRHFPGKDRRRAAEAVGLKVHGTLSVVGMAVKQGYIESLTSAVAKLKGAGLYVSDDVIAAVQKTFE